MPERREPAARLACPRAGRRNLASSKANTNSVWPYLLSLSELSAEIQYGALDGCIEAGFHADLPQQRRSQLPSHLCSFNPIDFAGAKGEEEGGGRLCRPQLRVLARPDPLVLLHHPWETTGGIRGLVQTPGQRRRDALFQNKKILP